MSSPSLRQRTLAALSRAIPLALWAIPLALCAWIYSFALRSYFQQDDFAWLTLRSELHSWPDLFRILFEPRAQGTIRPWSERLFFLVLYDRFGLDHRPFHLVVALTQCANLFLLQSITFRITASRWAAVLAACLWLISPGLGTPMSWLATYNQILCAFFLLAAFRLLLQAIETGQMRWFWAQAAVFVLGFGALEVNIVYPILAAAWCALAARPWLKRTLTLLPISAFYAYLHFHYAPKPTEGVYARHYDLSIFKSYFLYWRGALAGWTFSDRATWPESVWTITATLLLAAACAVLYWGWRRGSFLPIFGFLWFTITLAPLLPLRDHYSFYYLAVPSIGLAWIAASAWQFSARAPRWALLLCALLTSLHIFMALPFNRATTHWHYARGLRIRSLVEGLERAHQLHPNQMIVLAGVDSDLFWSGYFDRPYTLYGLTETCLAPGSELAIESHPELGDIAPFLCAPPILADKARNRSLVAYTYEDGRLRNFTRKFISQNSAQWASLPEFLDIGSPAYARFLGPGWYEINDGFRWMSTRAELTLAPPRTPASAISLSGYCPATVLDTPVRLTVAINGITLGARDVTRETSGFTFTFPLPQQLENSKSLNVVLTTNRSVTVPTDNRPLGLVFGRIGITTTPSEVR